MLKDAERRALPFAAIFEALSACSLVSSATILVVLAGVIRIALRPAAVQHDVAMYLEAGELLLRGQRPYVDFIDVNPPLIIYLSALPAAVAKVLRSPIVPTALFMTAGAAAVSLASTRRTLVRAFEEAGSDTLLAEVAILALAFALFLSDVPERLDLPYPGNPLPDPRLSAIFGQREHLLVIGAAPFIAVRFARSEGLRIVRRSALFAGAAASLVTCLKPQFVIVLVALEVGLLAVRRARAMLRTPEMGAFLLVAVAYAAHFALLPSAVRSAFFGRWLPFVVQGYGVFNEPSYWDLVVRCWPALAALVVAYAMTVVGDAAGGRLIRLFAWMAGAGAVLYVAQKKGWTYHAFPERTFAGVALACSLASARALGTLDDTGARLVLPFTRRRISWVLAGVVGVTGVACVVCLALVDTPKDVDRLRRRSQVMRTIESFTKEGDPVLVATTSVWDPFPALTLQNRLPGSRYLWLFPIPMLQAVGHDVGDPEGDFVRELAEDLRERRPPLLLLQTGRCFGCGKTSVDAFFREHAPLAEALTAYSLRGTVRDGQELQVFVRER